MSRLLDKLEATARLAVAEKACPGGVYAVIVRSSVTVSGAFGQADPERGSPASDATIYDAASITKPVATATSVCCLVERGELTLDQRLTNWFPEAKRFGDVTLRHLITHTSGLPAWRTYFENASGSKAIIELALRTPLDRRPGIGYTYSDIGYMLLAAVVERVSGLSLREFAAQNIYQPLGMADTGFTPSAEHGPRYAVTGHCGLRPGKTLRGEVHDPNAAAMGGVAGHAGLFTTLRDLTIYARMILEGGEFGSVRVLSPATVREMSMSQIPPEIGGHTLGWFAYPNGYLPRADLLSRRTFGHTGFTGTALVFDPEIEAAFILLTNRVFCDPENDRFLTYRRKMLNVMAAIASES